MTFDDITAWVTTFHILQILDSAERFATRLLEAMECGDATINWSNAAEHGVPVCSCDLFRHYWPICDHALAWLTTHNIVTKPPPLLDPTPADLRATDAALPKIGRDARAALVPKLARLQRVSTGGRPHKARRGGALERDDEPQSKKQRKKRTSRKHSS